MYTLGAALGVVVVYALLCAVQSGEKLPGAKASGLRCWKPARNRQTVSQSAIHSQSRVWWTVYALAAAAGMYTLYYFVFFSFL